MGPDVPDEAVQHHVAVQCVVALNAALKHWQTVPRNLNLFSNLKFKLKRRDLAL